MYAAAEGGENADAPVAEFIARALDDDGAVVGHGTCGSLLIIEEGEQVLSGNGIEVVLRDESRECCGARHFTQLTDEHSDAEAELKRPTCAVAFPERHFAGFAGSRLDKDAVVCNLCDAPGGCSKDERLVGACLKDHLFVKLANADGFAFRVRKEDAVKSAIRDGTGIEDGDACGALASSEHVAHAVPGDARAKVCEFVGWIAATEKIEYAFKGRAC